MSESIAGHSISLGSGTMGSHAGAVTGDLEIGEEEEITVRGVDAEVEDDRGADGLPRAPSVGDDMRGEDADGHVAVPDDPAGSAVQDERRLLLPSSLYGIILTSLAGAFIAVLILYLVDDEPGLPTPSSPSKNDKVVTGPSVAQVPEAFVNILPDIVALPPGVDGRHQLALPADMFERLNGQCAYLEQYTAAENSDAKQCTQNEHNPNFVLENGSGIPYVPSLLVRELLSNATGATVSAINRTNIGSQPNVPDGAWCGMPAAGSEKLAAGVNLTGQEKLAYDYWLKCVTPRAGYLNVLQCNGRCDENGENCSTYAVIGYAAMEPGVCYPAHAHASEEAYWQIGGRGWWRTWNNITGLGNFTSASNENFGGSKNALHAQRSNIPHELDTTTNFDGDDGVNSFALPMAMVYWWAKNEDTPNNYRWASQVRGDENHPFQESAQSCGNDRRIPKYDETRNQDITTGNC